MTFYSSGQSIIYIVSLEQGPGMRLCACMAAAALFATADTEAPGGWWVVGAVTLAFVCYPTRHGTWILYVYAVKSCLDLYQYTAC